MEYVTEILQARISTHLAQMNNWTSKGNISMVNQCQEKINELSKAIEMLENVTSEEHKQPNILDYMANGDTDWELYAKALEKYCKVDA